MKILENITGFQALYIKNVSSLMVYLINFFAIISKFPETCSSLQTLSISSCTLTSDVDFSHLKNLYELNMDHVEGIQSVSGLYL